MKKYHKTGGKPGKPAYPSTKLRASRTPSSFRSKVFKVVEKIPRGKTLIYKQVAERAGNPKACRAVGSILSKNFNPKISCHRVIRSD